VEPATALAPLDHVDAEVSAFPKGHVAMPLRGRTRNRPAPAYRFGEKNSGAGAVSARYRGSRIEPTLLL